MCPGRHQLLPEGPERSGCRSGSCSHLQQRSRLHQHGSERLHRLRPLRVHHPGRRRLDEGAGGSREAGRRGILVLCRKPDCGGGRLLCGVRHAHHHERFLQLGRPRLPGAEAGDHRPWRKYLFRQRLDSRRRELRDHVRHLHGLSSDCRHERPGGPVHRRGRFAGTDEPQPPGSDPVSPHEYG